jgi:NADH-quinone oxidoreductase subunit J
METAIFVLFALLAVVSAVVVVAHRNPIYSTLSLVVTLFSVAVLFLLLGAQFLAALQILIYAGAIVVLFLFVVMLLNLQKEERQTTVASPQIWGALLGAAVFAGMLLMLVWRSIPRGSQVPLTAEFVSLQNLATELFQKYLLPFEMIGLLLLVAVIAATVLARKPELGESEPPPDRAERAEAAGGVEP